MGRGAWRGGRGSSSNNLTIGVLLHAIFCSFVQTLRKVENKRLGTYYGIPALMVRRMSFQDANDGQSAAIDTNTFFL